MAAILKIAYFEKNQDFRQFCSNLFISDQESLLLMIL